MAKCSIGKTRTGKDIVVETDAWKGVDFLANFDGFTDHEAFDALMTTESFYVVVSRRKYPDTDWLLSLEVTAYYLSESRLTPERVLELRSALGLKTVFEARDYGSGLLLPALRK